MSATARTEAVERLRALIQASTPAPVLSARGCPTQLPALDAWVGGWPRPGVVELIGAPGSGRLGCVLPGLAAHTRSGSSVLLVDPGRQVYPPGWAGVSLERVVLARPSPERAAWVAEQAARSGAVAAVLLLDAPPLGRAGLRVARAAEVGLCTVFVVSGAADADLPAALRLRVEGWADGRALRIACLRSRRPQAEGVRTIPLVEDRNPS
jgi:hypothetical protein